MTARERLLGELRPVSFAIAYRMLGSVSESGQEEPNVNSPDNHQQGDAQTLPKCHEHRRCGDHLEDDRPDRGRKPMSDLQAIADRVEIEALRGEFIDAGMMRDYDRFASLFTQDAVWRIPVVNVEFVGREEIRAGIERLGEGLWDYLVQTTHPGTIQLEGDTASGRAYVLSFGHMRDGSSHLNYSVYHDRYRRTSEGWKFTERADEIKYLDTTPLAGSPPQNATTTGDIPRSA
jgi:ketosteroid isomerase-like protein